MNSLALPFKRVTDWLHTAPSQITSLLCAIVLVAGTFSGVFFFGRSILPSAVWNEFSVDTGKPSAAPLWEPKHRRTADGYADNFSGVLQFEPIQIFMRNCMRDGESPYWNPYSASGALGPESLVDSKFSFFTLAASLAGATSAAFHVVLFGIQIASLYCLHQLLRKQLQLGLAAAFTGCAVYLLGGYHQTYFNNHIAQPYILAPLLLWPLLGYISAPSSRRFLGMVLAHMAIQSTGFVPGIIIIYLFAGLLGFAYAIEQPGGLRAGYPRLIFCCLALLMAGLLLAPLWLPFAASLRDSTLLLEYSGRSVKGPSINALLSQFSPEHFWESYSAYQLLEGKKMLAGAKQPGFINHWGIIAAMLAAVSLGAPALRKRPVFWVLLATLLLGHGMEWQWPGFKQLAGLPVLRSIRPQYWGNGSLPALAFLAAFGIQSLDRRSALSWPVLLFSGIIGYAFYLASKVAAAIPTLYWWRSASVLVILGVTLLLLAIVRFFPSGRRIMIILLPLCLTLEMVNYFNHLQPAAYRLENNLPPWVDVIRRNVGDGRTLSLGQRTMLPEWGSALKIEQAESMGASKLKHYAEFWGTRLAPARTLFLRFESTSPKKFEADRNAIDLLGARLIIVRKNALPALQWMDSQGFRRIYQDKERVILQNPSALARSFIVSAVSKGNKTPWEAGFAAEDVVTSEDAAFLQEASAAGVPLVTKGPGPAQSIPQQTVWIMEKHHTSKRLKARLDKPGVLVLTESWSPHWKVYVDGIERHLGRVNIAFRGVVLPPGEHEILFRYHTPLLQLSIIVSVIAAIAVAILLHLSRRHLDLATPASA